MGQFTTWSRHGIVSLLLLAVATGIVAAIGATIFHLLIEFSTWIFFQIPSDADFASNLASLPDWKRVLIPTAGGFLVGLIFTFIKLTEAEGEGVPEVMKAVAFRHSKIRALIAPIKILTTAITLGSGGSAGREGPTVQIGSAIGSAIGQLFKQDESRTRLLLGAGAAAGIAGTFGAPLAGILFSTELILKRIDRTSLVVLIIAAFTSAEATKRMLGYPGLRFTLPHEIDTTLTTLLLSLVLGIVAAGISLLFGFILHRSALLFHHWRVPHVIPPTIGGLLIGLIGLYVPYIHEPTAYPLMSSLLSLSSLPFLFMVLLLFAKMFATGITLGSGGSGGVFAPALLIGTLLGNSFALTLGSFGFGTADSITTFALVGMAAVFAGITHAPFTALFIMFEITGEGLIVPAVIVAAFTSYLLSYSLRKESVYTEHLTRKKIV
ncbi:MAG: chloride channel protein [Patescibacteria group bacterium]